MSGVQKPSAQPRWATGGGALITAPSSGAQDTGHLPDTALTAQLLNWFWNLVYQWIAYFDAFSQTIDRAEVAALHNTSLADVTFSVGMADVASNGTNLLVAVGQSSGEIFTSTNLGRSWVSRTPAASFSGAWYGVLWASGLGLFIAVGNGTIQTSPDGITWTQRVSNGGTQNRTIAYGGGRLVVSTWDGGSTYSTYTSTDGLSWTAQSQSAALSRDTLAYGNGVFVSPSDGTGSTTVYWSTDGVTWHGTMWGSTSSMHANQVRYVPVAGYFVAFGSLTGGFRELQHSTDGATWARVRTASGSGAGALLATDVAAYAFYGDRAHESWMWLNGECTSAGDFTTAYEWSWASGAHARVLPMHGRTRVAMSYSSDGANNNPSLAYFLAA